MSKAKAIVADMLGEAYDEHVKAHERIQKWDQAHTSAKKLLGLKIQSLAKFRELGRALAYERALASVGVRKEDVESYIYGGQIGATDNYKRTRPAKVCQNKWCSKQPRPASATTCPECQEELVPTEIPLSGSYIRDRLANHILGVMTKDGRRLWFDDPVPPTFDVDADPEALAPKAKPNRPYFKNFNIREKD